MCGFVIILVGVIKMIGKKIKELREARGLTQAQLSQEFGINLSTLASYESEAREPKISMILKFADHFDVSIDYLLGQSNVKHAEDATVAEDLGIDDRAIDNLKQCKDMRLCANDFIRAPYFIGLLCYITAYWNIEDAELVNRLGLSFHESIPIDKRRGLLKMEIDDLLEAILEYGPIEKVKDFDDSGEG